MKDARAQESKSAFRHEVSIEMELEASKEQVWALITNAKELVRWNSTVISIDGDIALGNKIGLVSTVAPERTFKLKVATFEKNQTMQWKDGFAPMFQGVRTYAIEEVGNGKVNVSMKEVFSGLMLPMISPSLPDFKPSFEAWMKDLAQELAQV